MREGRDDVIILTITYPTQRAIAVSTPPSSLKQAAIPFQTAMTAMITMVMMTLRL